MTASASIYSLIRQPQIEGPLDVYGKAATIRNLMRQGEMQDMQMAQTRDQLGRQGKLRDLFATGRPTPEQVMAVDPGLGMQLRKSDAEIAKAEADASKTRSEAHAKNIGIMRDLTAQAGSDADMPGIREAAFRLFGPEVADKVPASFDPEWQQRGIMSADQMLSQLAAQREQAVSMRGQDLSAQTAQRGQDISAATTRRGQDQPVWDSERGVFVPRPQSRLAPRALDAPPPISGEPPATPVSGATAGIGNGTAANAAPRPQARQAGVPGAISVPGIQARPKPTPFENTLQQESAKQYAKIISDGQKVNEEDTVAEEALDAFLKYSRSNIGGTGPFATGFGAKAYLDEETQALRAIFNKINLKAMVKTFSGMSRAVDTQVERDAWNATQPSIELDDKVNARILAGALSLSEKTKAEAKAQRAWMEQNQTLKGYESPVIGKVDVLFAPDGTRTIVPKTQVREMRARGFVTGNEYADRLLKSNTRSNRQGAAASSGAIDYSGLWK